MTASARKPRGIVPEDEVHRISYPSVIFVSQYI